MFSSLAAYNSRANREMFQALSGLTDKARKRENGSWFSSIHGILNHILVCDINWMQRFRPLAPDAPALKADAVNPPNLSWEHYLYEEFLPMREHRAELDTLIKQFFGEIPESIYTKDFNYTDSSGEVRSAKGAQAFLFFFTHQTHHRGQISQILDELGVPQNFTDNGPFLNS